MRITGGRHRGRRIVSPEGRRARPTLQVARKSIFDTLGDLVDGAVVLDLFCGVGTLGLEALSRGATTATFVDVDQKILDTVKDNVDLLSLEEHVKVMRGKAIDVVRRLAGNGVRYDLIFVDPPYQSEELAATLEAFSGCELLSEEGMLVVEYPKQTKLPDRIGRLLLWRNRRFGDTSISFYRKQKE